MLLSSPDLHSGFSAKIMIAEMKNIKKLIKEEKYDEVQRILTPMAHRGDGEAQFFLGFLMFTSADVSLDESFYWLKAAADQEHADAMYYLSITSHDSVADCFTSGYPESDSDRKLLVRSAELGSKLAQRDLGCFLSTGDGGFTKDETEGRRWYLSAAENGHVDAQYNVGMMFLYGEGGKEDKEKATYWLEKAAMAENPEYASLDATKVLIEEYKLKKSIASKDDKAISRLQKRKDKLEKILKIGR